MAERTSEPTWAWILAGVTAGLLWHETRPSAPVRISADEAERWRSELDPARMPPRELRRLPGVGRTRAIAAARARWEHDPKDGPLAWSDVDGIGEKTEKRVTAWLLERGAGSVLLAPEPKEPNKAHASRQPNDVDGTGNGVREGSLRGSRGADTMDGSLAGKNFGGTAEGVLQREGDG